MNIKTFVLNFLSVKWTIGFIENDLTSILAGDMLNINWIKHNYKDRWLADPFILDVTEKEIIVLCEEYYYPIKHGRIAKLVIDRKTYVLKESIVVLELESHLSFPAILRKGDAIYLYPENSKRGVLSCYKYDQLNNLCVKCEDIIQEPLTDAVITDLFGEKLMFSTKIPRQNLDKLNIYRWVKNKCILYSSVNFSSHIARNAGDFFQCGGEVYRPAQDCNKLYGGAVVLQKVKKDNTVFQFVDICRIESENSQYNIGCHTFNHYKNYTVIDAKGYHYPIIAAILLFIRDLLKKKR